MVSNKVTTMSEQIWPSDKTPGRYTLGGEELTSGDVVEVDAGREDWQQARVEFDIDAGRYIFILTTSGERWPLQAGERVRRVYASV